VEQGHRHGELLAHAARKSSRQPALRAFEPDSPESGFDLLVQRLIVESVRPPGEAEVLECRQVAIDAPVGRHEA
jgi:hypothetical protein